MLHIVLLLHPSIRYIDFSDFLYVRIWINIIIFALHSLQVHTPTTDEICTSGIADSQPIEMGVVQITSHACV
jgi:hypothetical protein